MLVTQSQLDAGRGKFCSQSCGTGRRFRKHGGSRGSHPLYNAWNMMKQRCSNPKATLFERYGGRGIKVCERWLSFENFVADMGERPVGATLDRLDNNRDYGPGNCRWATRREQARNTSRNWIVSYQGRDWHVTDLARELGVVFQTLRHRILMDWPEHEWASAPTLFRKRHARQSKNV